MGGEFEQLSDERDLYDDEFDYEYYDDVWYGDEVLDTWERMQDF